MIFDELTGQGYELRALMGRGYEETAEDDLAFAADALPLATEVPVPTRRPTVHWAWRTNNGEPNLNYMGTDVP